MNIQAQSETLSFQAEVPELVDLVVHSLYSNKEIFLRELISNSSDALDKLRFASLNDAALYEKDSELKIEIYFDPKERTITVRDNGIGMSREEIVSNLGTIAKSGTRDFLRSLSGDKAKDTHLIGQFGVGFYASFVVSDEVTVKSRRAGMLPDQGVVWKSQGRSEFTVANIEKADRGTEVILHLKKGEDEFLDDWRLRNIITKYSDHILFPILMYKQESDEKAAKSLEQVNRATALWRRPKKEITDEEYKELYKHISHDFEDPLLYSHNVVEGKLEYTTLLYIPAQAPFDLWQRDRRHGLKLYVERVFIMDNAEQLLPHYLRFVRGIVDAKDLPLNVSRELLQHNNIIEGIRLGIIKRVLDMLENLAKDDPDKYTKFWQTFGQVLKEGIAEDHLNKERIAKLLRFASSYKDSEEQNVSLDDYLSRMKEGQDKIYYIIADSFAAADNSPHLEIFRKKGVEVLLLSDRIDEWVVAGLTEYNGKELKSVTRGDLDLSKLIDQTQEEKSATDKNELAPLAEKMQKILAEKIKEVRVSSRLIDSPACLVADEKDLSMHLQKIMKSFGQDIPANKPILEINPKHPLIERLHGEMDEQRFREWTEFLFAAALLAEGESLENPAAFVKQVNKLLLGTT